jgi:hypothetical protein
MANLFPPNDNDFSNGLGNFLTVAAANLVALGLTAADITAGNDAKTDIDAKIADATAAKEAAKSSTGAKAVSRKSGDAVLRALIKKVEATPDVPVALILDLGMSVRDSKPTPVHPSTPTALYVIGSDTGVNNLKWNRNGNKSGTMYIIEARVGESAVWQFVNATTRPDYEDAGRTPGQKVAYRVKAKRPAGESQYSNVATVYDSALPIAA